MKYYIVKPMLAKTDTNLLNGIRWSDPKAVIVKKMDECNQAVLQKKWNKSKSAIRKKKRLMELGKPCSEGYSR